MLRNMRDEAFVSLSMGRGAGESVVDGLWAALTRRLGFAFGLVIAIAMLGALAFTSRSDVRVLWFDEKGRPTVGMLRTETQERLEQALRDTVRSAQLLEAEKAHGRSRGLEVARIAQQLQRAGDALADHTKKIAVLDQENARLTKLMEGGRGMRSETAVETAIRDKDRQISELKAQLHAARRLNEYRADRVGDEAYLPLRDRPERASRVIKEIPSRSAGIQSACKVAVYEDAVFIEASYQGVTGWVSGYYLAAP